MTKPFKLVHLSKKGVATDAGLPSGDVRLRYVRPNYPFLPKGIE